MNALRGLITLLIALIMVKLFIDLIMFIFVGSMYPERQALRGNLRGF